MNNLTPKNDTLGIGFSRIKAKYKIPEFVKESSLATLSAEATSALPVHAFGDPIRREYPCHTKEATWLSCAYFVDNYETIKPAIKERVQRRLEKQAELFRIMPEIKALLAKKVATVKEAMAVPEYSDDCYLFFEKSSGVRSGLLNNEEAVNTAADWLVANRNDLTLKKCADCANRIIKRANNLGMTTFSHRDCIERMNGIGIADKDSVIRAIGVRTSLSKHAELNTELSHLAEKMKNADISSIDPDMLKVAVALDEFDINAELLPYRRRGELRLPEETIYRHSLSDLKKYASETVHLQNGEVYSLSKIATLDRLKFESTFGSDLTDECFDNFDFRTKNASSVLATLPRTEAERFGAFLKTNGIEPEHKTKAASAVIIPQAILDSYAK